MEDVVRIGQGWASPAGKLAKFTALALGAAAAVKLGLLIASMPPGDAAFAFAPGQTRAQISLDALGDRTDYFAVAESGVGIVVQAPKGAKFVSATGAASASSEISLAPNARRLIRFSMINDDGSERSDRVVDFRSWSARGVAYWQESAGPAPNASWISHDSRSGKYTTHNLDGADYRYALKPGQSSAALALAWIPTPDSGGAAQPVDLLRASVSASRPFVVDLIAPPGMKFRFRDESSSRKYRMSASSSGPQTLRFSMIDAYGSQSELTVELASSIAPTPARAAPRM